MDTHISIYPTSSHFYLFTQLYFLTTWSDINIPNFQAASHIHTTIWMHHMDAD